MAGPSSSIHPPPTLTRGPTRKAVLTLEVRSRTLQIAAWADPSAACAWIYTYMYVYVACPECSCGCRTLFYEYLDSSRPSGAARLRLGSFCAKSEQSLPYHACNQPTQLSLRWAVLSVQVLAFGNTNGIWLSYGGQADVEARRHKAAAVRGARPIGRRFVLGHHLLDQRGVRFWQKQT